MTNSPLTSGRLRSPAGKGGKKKRGPPLSPYREGNCRSSAICSQQQPQSPTDLLATQRRLYAGFTEPPSPASLPPPPLHWTVRAPVHSIAVA